LVAMAKTLNKWFHKISSSSPAGGVIDLDLDSNSAACLSSPLAQPSPAVTLPTAVSSSAVTLPTAVPLPAAVFSSAVPSPSLPDPPASSHGVEVTLPIKRQWFDKIASGEKCAEFRECSPYWRRRLLKPDLQRLRLLNGRRADAPFLLCALRGVEFMSTLAIPEGLAPPPGTAEHRELFGDTEMVICLHLGEILQIHDPNGEEGARRRSTNGEAVLENDLPVPPAGATGLEQCCPRCGLTCVALKCSKKGPNRRRNFWKCPERCGEDVWIGWAPEHSTWGGRGSRSDSASVKPSGVGLVGRSFQQLQEEERAGSERALSTARARQEDNVRGEFVTFDRRKNIRTLADGRASGVAAVGNTELASLRAEINTPRTAEKGVPAKRQRTAAPSIHADMPDTPTPSANIPACTAEIMRLARLARFEPATQRQAGSPPQRA